jgi:hypothetical protein
LSIPVSARRSGDVRRLDDASKRSGVPRSSRRTASTKRYAPSSIDRPNPLTTAALPAGGSGVVRRPFRLQPRDCYACSGGRPRRQRGAGRARRVATTAGAGVAAAACCDRTWRRGRRGWSGIKEGRQRTTLQCALATGRLVGGTSCSRDP